MSTSKSEKFSKINFAEIITKIAERTHSVEFSFVTTILATICTDLPLGDKYVG